MISTERPAGDLKAINREMLVHLLIAGVVLFGLGAASVAWLSRENERKARAGMDRLRPLLEAEQYAAAVEQNLISPRGAYDLGRLEKILGPIDAVTSKLSNCHSASTVCVFDLQVTRPRGKHGMRLYFRGQRCTHVEVQK
ncbi:hypothetical protein MCEMSE15_00081 [Fimbriimonadaceae bacterium]